MGIETDFQNLTPTKKVETAKLTKLPVFTDFRNWYTGIINLPLVFRV